MKEKILQIENLLYHNHLTPETATELLSDICMTEIKAAIDFGKEIKSEKARININFGSPYIDYEDSTKETQEYIESKKLSL
jgi:hypothetical protein